MFFTYNHRKTLGLSRSKKPVIIIATKTEIPVLLTHVYPPHNNAKQWLMKTSPGIFIDIKTICNFFGKSLTCLKGFTNQSYFSREFHVHAKKIKLLSLQGNNSMKMNNTKTVPN